MFAALLAQHFKKEAVYIRKKGKIAPPTFSCKYGGSHVALSTKERAIEKHELVLKVGDILPGNHQRRDSLNKTTHTPQERQLCS